MCLQLTIDSDAGKSNITLSAKQGQNVGSISQHLNFGRTLLTVGEDGLSKVGLFFDMYQAQEASGSGQKHSSQIITKDFVKLKAVKYAPPDNVLAFIFHYLMPIKQGSGRGILDHDTDEPLPLESTDWSQYKPLTTDLYFAGYGSTSSAPPKTTSSMAHVCQKVSAALFLLYQIRCLLCAVADLKYTQDRKAQERKKTAAAWDKTHSRADVDKFMLDVEDGEHDFQMCRMLHVWAEHGAAKPDTNSKRRGGGRRRKNSLLLAGSWVQAS